MSADVLIVEGNPSLHTAEQIKIVLYTKGGLDSPSHAQFIGCRQSCAHDLERIGNKTVLQHFASSRWHRGYRSASRLGIPCRRPRMPSGRHPLTSANLFSARSA